MGRGSLRGSFQVGPLLAQVRIVFSRAYKSVLFAAVVIAITLVHLTPARPATINTDEAICNVSADTALGSENYSQAIVLHQRLIEAHGKNALAHYHLGFAYGMVGEHEKELAEYRKASELGLRQWDLYLNLGRLYLEKGDYPSAVEALTTAELLGPEHPETHFNLGLAYERQQKLALATQEIQTAMRLGADPASAGNMLAVIYAENGNPAAARSIWAGLALQASSAEVARANLVLLDHLATSRLEPPSRELEVARIAPDSSNVVP